VSNKSRNQQIDASGSLDPLLIEAFRFGNICMECKDNTSFKRINFARFIGYGSSQRRYDLADSIVSQTYPQLNRAVSLALIPGAWE
jgi:hypothetical protein